MRIGGAVRPPVQTKYAFDACAMQSIYPYGVIDVANGDISCNPVQIFNPFQIVNVKAAAPREYFESVSRSQSRSSKNPALSRVPATARRLARSGRLGSLLDKERLEYCRHRATWRRPTFT
jgi:hypothetical protein